MFAKKTVFFVSVFALMFCLAGCMSAGDEDKNAVTAAPTQQPTATAAATAQPAAFDWNRESKNVEAAIVQLSEIKEARVAINGDTALVGVRFDDAYKGEMTDRIREMIAGVVQKADPNIKTVAVTAEENDVNSIFDMAERVASGAGEVFDDFTDDIKKIVNNVTTMR